MSLRIDLPPATRLLEAKGTKSANSCPASAWSCSTSGNVAECRPSACALTPGDQTAIGVDVRLLPQTPITIPPGGITKTICGDLKWFAPEGEGPDIEQMGGERHSRACVTTRILAVKEPEPEGVKPKPMPYDLTLKKFGPAQCWPGGACSYAFTFLNTGPVTFSGPITFTDELPSGWKMIPPGFMPCTQKGDLVTCQHPPQTLKPNWPETSILDARVPENETRTEVENCAWFDHDTATGDIKPGNNKGCVTTKITPKLLPATPPPPCPVGQQWDPIEKTCVPVPALLEPKPEKADLAVHKSGPEECTPGGVCLYELTVTNRGPGGYEAPLTIIDQRPQGWKLLGGFPSPPWECTKAGTAIECRRGVALAPGDSATLLLELKVPGRAGAAPREVENCARIEWPGTAADRQRGSVTEVQHALNELGYEVGRADGKLGRRTRAAITRYQKDRGLPQTGAIDDRLVRSLVPATAAAPGDPNPKNDRACMTTSIKGPLEEAPPEPAPPRPAPPEVAPPSAAPPKVTPPRVTPPKVTPPSKQPVGCRRGQHWDRTLGRCVCRKDQRWNVELERCVPREITCPPGYRRVQGRCLPPPPRPSQPPPKMKIPGKIIVPPPRITPMPACRLGTVWHAPTKRCIKPPG